MRTAGIAKCKGNVDEMKIRNRCPVGPLSSVGCRLLESSLRFFPVMVRRNSSTCLADSWPSWVLHQLSLHPSKASMNKYDSALESAARSVPNRKLTCVIYCLPQVKIAAKVRVNKSRCDLRSASASIRHESQYKLEPPISSSMHWSKKLCAWLTYSNRDESVAWE